MAYQVRWWQKVFLSSNHKTSSRQVLAGRRAFANLRAFYPPSRGNNLKKVILMTTLLTGNARRNNIFLIIKKSTNTKRDKIMFHHFSPCCPMQLSSRWPCVRPRWGSWVGPAFRSGSWRWRWRRREDRRARKHRPVACTYIKMKPHFKFIQKTSEHNQNNENVFGALTKTKLYSSTTMTKMTTLFMILNFFYVHQASLKIVKPDLIMQLPLDDELVLLLISSCDDEVVFSADEPIKLLEPESLSCLGHQRRYRHLS